MLIYDTPPELGAMWEEFQIDRARLVKDKVSFDKAQKKRMRKKHWKGVFHAINETFKSPLSLVFLPSA